MRARLPYAAQDQMTEPQLTSFASRGGRFRSRPGAPMAGTSGPIETASRNASWGTTFGERSTYGTRPLTDPVVRISPLEGEAITARRISPTDASGDAAGLARNMAMAQPDAIHQKIIDDATQYHQVNGIPLPTPQGNANGNFISSKYGTASATFVPGQNNPGSPTYRARLAALGS